MACVERQRGELMRHLGIAVERCPCPPPSGAPRGDLGCPRCLEGLTARNNKARRRSSHSIKVEHSHALHQQQVRGQRRELVGGREKNFVRAIDLKCLRPNSAKLRALNSLRIPRSASSSTLLENNTNADNSGKTKRVADVLFDICRDQGCGYSLDPADFDSSVSAIYNLPVDSFVGAAKEGWGHYFRDLHGKMRATETTSSHCSRPRSTRKLQQSPAVGRERRKSSSNQQPFTATKHVLNNRESQTNNIRRAPYGKNRRQREDFDCLAASRARAEKLAVEEGITRRMAIRLQTLWQELKIPQPDRAYIVAVYLEGSMNRVEDKGADTGGVGENKLRGEKVHRELVRQIRLLLKYRTATIKVLRCVSLRESRLTEVEQALQAFQWHRGRDTDAISLVDVLVGLRGASLETVRALTEWRENLWQPRAFCWRGVNYLEKMSRDTLFLRSPVGKSLLSSVGLEAGDMTFVLFPSPSDDEPPPGGGPEAAAMDVRAPPTIVRLTPKAELVWEYRARFFGHPNGVVTNKEGSAIESQNTGTDGRIARDVEVVLQEASLQRRVDTERDGLATRGCFVPLLRWLPFDRNAPHDKRRRSSPPSMKASSELKDETKNTNIINSRDETCVETTRDLGVLPFTTNTETPQPELSGPTIASETTSRTPSTNNDERYVGATSREKLETNWCGTGIGGAPLEGTQSGKLGTHEKQQREEGGEGGNKKKEEDGKGDKVEIEPHESEQQNSDWDIPNSTNGVKALKSGHRPSKTSHPGYGENIEHQYGEPKDWLRPSYRHTDSEQSPEGPTRKSIEKERGKQESPLPEEGGGDEVLLMQGGYREGLEDGRKIKSGKGIDKMKSIPLMQEEKTEGVGFSGSGSSCDKWREQGVNQEETSILCAKTTAAISDQRSTLVFEDAHEVETIDRSHNLEVSEAFSNSENVSGDENFSGDNSSSNIVVKANRGVEGGKSLLLEEGEEAECDKSVTPSLLYDDDFEEDGQGNSRGDSETGADENSRSASEPIDDPPSKPISSGECQNKAETGDTRSDVISAIVVQCAWRWKEAVVKTELRRALRRTGEESAAAELIQKLVRVRAEKKRRHLLLKAENEGRNATKMQAWLLAWRAGREVCARRQHRDAAVRIQSTARRRLAADEVKGLRRNHETRRNEAALKIGAIARQRQNYRDNDQARQTALELKKIITLSTAEKQQRLVESAVKKIDRSSRMIQRALQEALRRRQQLSKRKEGSKHASLDSGHTIRIKGESTTAKTDSNKAHDDPSTIFVSSQALTSRKSSSSLTSAGLSSSSSAPGESEPPDSLDTSLSDASSSSLVDSCNPTVRRRRDIQGYRREVDGDNIRQNVAPAVEDGAESPSSLLGAAADIERAELPRQEENADNHVDAENISVAQTSNEDIRIETGAPSTPMSHSPAGGESAIVEKEEVIFNSPAFHENDYADATAYGGCGSVALFPVPEGRALLHTPASASASEYGSEDLHFDALSSSPSEKSIVSTSTGGAVVTSVGDRESIGEETLEGGEGFSNAAKSAVEGGKGDSDESLVSLDFSISD